MTIKGLMFTVLAAFIGWIGVMTGVMYLSDAAPAAVVIFPSQKLLVDLGDVSVLSANKVSITLASNEDRFAKRLYSDGAYLVLPAGLVGCLPLPGTKPKASQYTK
jgi:hypothetical protein